MTDYVTEFLAAGGKVKVCPEGAAKGIKGDAYRRHGAVSQKGRKAYSLGTGSKGIHSRAPRADIGR